MKINGSFALSDTEIEEFLREAKIIRVATHGPGERINLAPLWYCWAEGRSTRTRAGRRWRTCGATRAAR